MRRSGKRSRYWLRYSRQLPPEVSPSPWAKPPRSPATPNAPSWRCWVSTPWQSSIIPPRISPPTSKSDGSNRGRQRLPYRARAHRPARSPAPSGADIRAPRAVAEEFGQVPEWLRVCTVSNDLSSAALRTQLHQGGRRHFASQACGSRPRLSTPADGLMREGFFLADALYLEALRLAEEVAAP